MNTDEHDRNRLSDDRPRQQRYSKIETVILVIIAAALLAALIILAVRDAGAAPPSPRPCPVGYIAKPCPPTWGPACAQCERVARWVPVRRR